MLIRIHPENPSYRQIRMVVGVLEKGGIIIYPTDTVYGMGCDITNQKALEKVARLKGVNPSNPNFSFIFHSLSQLSDYTKQVNNVVFKLMKKHLPGPFTFILNANNQVPKMFKSKKKTVGIRIPNNNIALEIVREFGRPILTTSIRDSDEVIEYTTDPELIYEKYKNLVDIVIDGGYGNNEASTIIDCTGEEPEIIRHGLGILEF
jgi:tRNA threonylcarbamoyl adenosine modification protein (Sua5/YciO/YrdC/YwlC family)